MTRCRLPATIVQPPRWRRLGPTVLVVALLTACVAYDRIAWAPAAGEGDDWSRYHDQTFPVVHVVDGDTLDIGVADGDKPHTRIRLWGVDTPETGTGGTTRMYFGLEAKRYAEQSLHGKAVHVVLSPDNARDRYGRLLAYVYLERGGPMFNELLLEEGCAYADLRFPHHYADRFKAVEQVARRGGRGLWAEVTTERMPAWRQRFEQKSKRRD